MAGAAGDRVPALPRAPAEAAAGRFAEVAAGRFDEASAGRLPFPRADGSSSPTGCVMLHGITTKQKVWRKNQGIEVKVWWRSKENSVIEHRSSKFGGEVKKTV